MNSTPPNTPPAVAKKAGEAARLDQAVTDLDHEIEAASAAVTEAEAADETAFAEAIRASKADPGTPAAEQAGAKLAALQRRRSATLTAAQQAHAETAEAVKASAATWSSSNTKRQAEAAASFAAALDQASKATAVIAETLGIAHWLDNGASRFYKPFRPHTGLQALNGEPIPVEDVLAVLQQWVDTTQARAEAAA